MPVRDLIPRHRELGRLRMGAKTTSKAGKEIPVKLKTWRLTSSNLAALNAAAQMWGGTVEEWSGQYELITETSEIPVLVPPQDLQAAQWYTLYSGGGIQRRCDGITEFETDGPCICATEIEGTENERQCSVTTHLLLVLPQLPDIGVWRLTTNGWNAAVELANTIDLLQQFVARGQMPEAIVAIEPRTSKREGQTRNFIVPVLRIPKTLEALTKMTGRAALPGQPFDPETGEILEHDELPAGLARSGQEESTGSGSDGPGPVDTTSWAAGTPVGAAEGGHPAAPADGADDPAPVAEDTSAGGSVPDQGPVGGETLGGASETTPQEQPPAEDPDDGTPATPEQWALLERQKNVTPTKILTKARHLFPDNPPRAKSEITKYQFAKAFGAVMDSKAGVKS